VRLNFRNRAGLQAHQLCPESKQSPDADDDQQVDESADSGLVPAIPNALNKMPHRRIASLQAHRSGQFPDK
jgi:hypothetical protein